MRRWACGVCEELVRFDASVCPNCDSSLGYIPSDLAVRVVTSDDGIEYTVDGHDGRWWRCLNAPYACNWMLPAGTGAVWCRSCRLTRGRPDDARSDAVVAWATTEVAKRRLIHQLDSLDLGVDALSPEQSDGLMFDLVHLDDGGVTTGYSAGVVTLDLAEADDQHRDHLRRQLGESFRTVIGHLRHEAGHHYFHRLVSQSNDRVEFRALFGDERDDYAEALSAHYAAPEVWDPDRHVTAYATSHPLEDWAESFAHYLHIADAAETADDHGIVAPGGLRPTSGDFADLLGYWRFVVNAVNDVAESLGLADFYPFTSNGPVVDKLQFVHRQIAKNSERRTFYTAE